MLTTSKAKIACLAACLLWALPLVAEQPPRAELITAHRIGTTPPMANYLATHHPAPYAPVRVFPVGKPGSHPGKGNGAAGTGGGNIWSDSVLQPSASLGPSANGVRWYQLKSTGGSWNMAQQGTYGLNDGLYRWMGSMAQDKLGDLRTGYSTSDANHYASIAFAAQAVGEASTNPGTLEQEIIPNSTLGQGAQGSVSRWGDYSSLSLDPTDDCTMWFATEYGKTNGSYYAWGTYITSFKFTGCN